MTKKRKAVLIAFYVILALYTVFCIIYVLSTMFEYQGKTYFSLFDDSMISMQYARNLAHGNGLVWMAGGDRVEGFSNPLWVFLMAGFHLLPIPTNWIGLPIIICGWIFMILALFYVRRITELFAGPESIAVPLAVFMAAFYYPITNWALLGTEVSIITFMTTLLVWMVINQIKSGKFSIWIFILLGIATWVRLDMITLCAATVGFLFLFDGKHRWKTLIRGGLIIFAFLAVQTLLRYLYYGDIMPNTAYLKVANGVLQLTIQRGLYVFQKFVWNFNLILFLLPFLYLIFRRDKSVWFLFLIIWTQIAYSIYIGGDAWEHRGGANRFFAFIMQFFMILFVLTANQIRLALQERAHAGSMAKRPKLAAGLLNGVLILFSGLSLLNFNTLLDLNSWKYIFLQSPPTLISTTKTVPIGLFVHDITTENARILVISAGGIPYYSERFCYDMLGKADLKIAHGPMHMPDGISLLDWRPGHNKWDWDYSVTQLKPDIITELWWQVPWQDVPKYLEDYEKVKVEDFKKILQDGSIYVRKGSPNILWDKIKDNIVAK